MSSALDTLANYVPQLIMRRLARDPTPLTEPFAESFPAAVLFADITGFTALTDQLAKQTSTGAEELTYLLNVYFEEIIELFTVHGGDVVKFAGDAVLVVWPVGHTDDDLRTVALRAAQCGLLVQTMLHNQQITESVRLSFRVGISAGEVYTAHVGGVYGRWELLVAGDPLIQMGRAEHQADPGQVILSPDIWALVKENCTGSQLSTGYVALEDVQTPLAYHSAPSVTLIPKAEIALRAYIPGTVLTRLVVHQNEWMAELRRLTILFVNLPEIDYARPGALEQIQQVMCTLQKAVYRFEGSINKLSVDDKGATLVAALGLPPLSHEDDPLRGVRVALAMQAEIHQMGLSCSIGVASGQTFCGSIGSDRRREYTMIGAAVNLAARLMQAASNSILCDRATYLSAKKHIVFEKRPPMSFKGKSLPVKVYHPLWQEKSMVYSTTEMIGRVKERTFLADQLQMLLRTEQNKTLLFEGDAGIGKTRLVEDLLRQAELLHITTFIGEGDSVEPTTPYYAWRNIFDKLWGFSSLKNPADQEAFVHNLLGFSGRLKNIAPLLNVIPPFSLPENEITRQMSHNARAENRQELLLYLLQASFPTSPKVLILENAHWIDPASLALANSAAQYVDSLLMAIVSRPILELVPAEFTYLKNAPNSHTLTLSPLPPEEIDAFICRQLGVRKLSEAASMLISRKAEGNPFFSLELVYAFQEAELLKIVGGVCRLVPNVVAMKTLPLSDSARGIVISRIDRLSPAEQLTLKVAGTIGRSFSFETLCAVFPVESDKRHLQIYLETLQKLDFICADKEESGLFYSFKHPVYQEVAYHLMLASQRKKLHKTIARWYETTYPDTLEKYHEILAYHWGETTNAAKAAAYLEMVNTRLQPT